MQTTIKFNRNPNLTSSSHPLIRIKDAQNGVGPISHLRMLRQRGFNLALHHQQHRGQNNRLQIVKAINLPMADPQEAGKKPVPAAEKEEGKVKERAEKKKELPPPPEKPEAGDCCGSGCARCVWDVYYEELDAYDEILKDFNNSPK